jgi:hypothetical protein
VARNVSPEAAAAHPLRLHTRLPERRRRNLVFVRCGRRSQHYKWYPLAPERNWDCMLSFYEDFTPQDLVQPEYALTGGVSKWDAFAQARFGHPEFGLDGYDHVLLADDDVEFQAPGDIDRLFDIAREHGLAACQPSLSAASHGFWAVTRNHPSWFLRHTNFIECMAPVFSREATDVLRDDLCAAVSGCGLDLILHRALGENRRLAVIDSVVVTHLQAQDLVNGAFYRMLRSIGVDHDEEIRWFLARYGIEGIAAATLGGVTVAQGFYPLRRS